MAMTSTDELTKLASDLYKHSVTCSSSYTIIHRGINKLKIKNFFKKDLIVAIKVFEKDTRLW